MENQRHYKRTANPRTDAAPLFWYFRLDPNEHAFAQDQEPPSSGACLNLKSTLKANAARDSHHHLTLDPTLPCIAELQTQDNRPSWPLSWFQQATELPSAVELAFYKEVCISRLRSQCGALTTLTDKSTASVRPPVSSAIASLGAALVGSSHQKDLWVHTNRVLIVLFAMNNEMTRNHFAYLAWMLNDLAAVMATDSEIIRSANITHGMIKTAMRRCFQEQQIQPSNVRPGPALGILLPCMLQADLVRSLRVHTIPTTVSAFGCVSLNLASKPTLKDLATTVFSHDDTKWTFDSQELAFWKLLLIWNEIVILALVPNTLHEDNFSSRSPISSLSVSEEIRRSRKRIRRGLSKWHIGYFPHMDAQYQALYHFCRLYLLMPGLHLLPADARSSYPIDFPQTPAMVYDQQPCFVSDVPLHSSKEGSAEKTSNSAETIHHAWRLYECISGIPPNSSNLSSFYLPVITFLAALCIWNDIGRQGESRAHGSTKVLQLFSLELRKMPWPCCRDMAGCLDSLA